MYILHNVQCNSIINRTEIKKYLYINVKYLYIKYSIFKDDALAVYCLHN